MAKLDSIDVLYRPLIFVCLIFALSLMPTNNCDAQPEGYSGFEIVPTAGYMFGGKLRGYNGELKLSDEFSYGIRISKVVSWGTSIDFSWTSMKSQARLRSYYDVSQDAAFDMGVNYFLIGASQPLNLDSDNVVPYGVLGLGASVFSAKNNDVIASGDEWFFSAEFGLGVKVYAGERIGFRFQGRFLLPMTFGGAGLWCGSGGCGSGVYTSNAILQGDLSVGLVIRL